MDNIIKVEISGEPKHELFRAAKNVDGVVIVTQTDNYLRLQGSESGFDELKQQLKSNRREEGQHGQHEYVIHCGTALSNLRSAL